MMMMISFNVRLCAPTAWEKGATSLCSFPLDTFTPTPPYHGAPRPNLSLPPQQSIKNQNINVFFSN